MSIDDTPLAANDTDTIASGSYGPATGNVLTDASAGDAGDSDSGADALGADGGTLTAITGFGGAGTIDGTTTGQYGVLTLNADGSYSYTRNAGTPGGVIDTFNYTITDGDGDTASATLTITIADAAAGHRQQRRLSCLTTMRWPAAIPAARGDDADARQHYRYAGGFGRRRTADLGAFDFGRSRGLQLCRQRHRAQRVPGGYPGAAGHTQHCHRRLHRRPGCAD